MKMWSCADWMHSMKERNSASTWKKVWALDLCIHERIPLLLHNPRNDEFHLSGYGFNAVVAVNLTFWRHFFIQSELKGGFINMPDIRITNDESEKGAQYFLFTQYNIVIGARIAVGK